MAQLNFQRQSLRYPPRISLGTLRLIENPDNIGNQIQMFCETVKGERVLLKDWGLPAIILQPISNLQSIQALILTNLKKYFPNVDEFTIELSTKQSALVALTVSYKTAKGYGTVTINY